MRWSKSIAETKIKTETAPHLFDVDDALCHPIHKVTKTFCVPSRYSVYSSHNVFNL